MTPPDPAHLSSRGRKLLDAPPMAEYIREHFDRVDDAWDPEMNPQGYVSMCIAENKIVADLLAPRLGRTTTIPPEALAYDSMIGSERFRAQLAAFLSRRLLSRTVRPENIVVLAGGGSVLELLFYSIGDPGDGVLVPTPSYFGFWPDLEQRNDLRIVPVHGSSDHGFRLGPEHFERAIAEAERPVKALLFTNPSNPLGTVSSPEEIHELWNWADTRGIHVVFDEVYALSLFGEAVFHSAASLRDTLGQRAHIVWAFSKDFAASGLRCGVLISENETVIEAIDGLAYWACCSGDTQFRLGQLIEDEEWVESFLSENRRRLGAAYTQVVAALQEVGIPYLPADAGFFILLNVRSFMREATWQEEQNLWRRILDEANVNLTPGAECHVGEPGFMRLCFASEPTEAVLAGIRRLGALLAA